MMKRLLLPVSLFLIQYCCSQPPFQLAPPLLRYSSSFFSGKTSFEVIFNQPGAEVRYTLNGQEPTMKDLLYSGPVTITKKTMVKVKTFGNNFIPSETVSASFIKDGKPILKAVYSKPNDSYAGSKPNLLHDNIGGQVNYRSGSWVGFDNDTVTVDIELQKKETVSNILISLLQDENSWIFLPEQIQVFYFNETQQRFLPVATQTFNHDTPGPKQPVIHEIKPAPAIHTNKLKLVFLTLKKIPAWHGGKGNHGWLFLDEIKVY